MDGRVSGASGDLVGGGSDEWVTTIAFVSIIRDSAISPISANAWGDIDVSPVPGNAGGEIEISPTWAAARGMGARGPTKGVGA